MKQLVIISGKGGTGKTSLTACFAALEKRLSARPPVIVDCDVDAPNLHLLLGGKVKEKEIFRGPPLAVIDRSKVEDTKECDQSCAFGAISGFGVDSLKCVGCAVCRLVCGEDAVRMKERNSGTIFERETSWGRFFHAELLPGQPGFGGLITALRIKGEAVAMQNPGTLLLTDGSPGLGCQVIASLTGCDLALIVSEPGKGALHDLARIRQLLDFFRIDARVVINRFDLDRSLAREVERYCLVNNLPVAGKIPFHSAFTEATLAGKPAVELGEEELNRNLEDIYQGVKKVLYGI